MQLNICVGMVKKMVVIEKTFKAQYTILYC